VRQSPSRFKRKDASCKDETPSPCTARPKVALKNEPSGFEVAMYLYLPAVFLWLRLWLGSAVYTSA
jgi:hypothetical protein